MKVFISDIHLGDGSKADDFNRDEAFIDFLKWTDNKAAEIIILGDLYELWQARLTKIMWHHHEVMIELEKRHHKITYVFGNHDYLPFSRLQPETYISKDGMIVAKHGHQYDKYNRFNNPLRTIRWPIGRWVTLGVAYLERLVSPKADTWLEKMRKKLGDFMVKAAEIQNRSPDKEDLDLELQVITGLRAQHIGQISIFGHNHNAEVLEIPCKSSLVSPCDDSIINNVWTFDGRRIYANCGSWIDDEYPTFVAVTKNAVQVRDGYEPDEVLEEVRIPVTKVLE
jgi:UDP-2,3-diacylglucosamine pyrophosphatase LpxH